MLRIATWNVNSLRVRLPHVLDWLALAKPDVLALQEIKMQDEQFPYEQFQQIGYQAIVSGQKTYNGVATLTRFAATDIVKDFPDFVDPQRRVLAATISGIRVLNLYVPNGESVDSEKYQYKLAWLAKLHNYCQQQLQQHDKMIILGDFNIAPDDRDVHDPTAWAGHVLVSERERQALQGLTDLGLVDTFRLFTQDDKIFSWWDYRGGAIWKNHGLRIDHIFATQALAERAESCEIDKKPRKRKRPSDHAPVIAQFRLD